MASPQKIGDIQPYAELKRGVATIAYKGFQKVEDRFVVLKVLRPEFVRDANLARQFEEEARKASTVRHPALAAVYSTGRENDQTYIVSEFVEGTGLDELIQQGRVPAELAAYVVQDVAGALKAVHDKSLLHRGVKPSNVIITRDGRVKLTDLGVSAALANGVKQGSSLAYRAPEGATGEAASETSDVFALGAVLFEMLAGEPAFQGDSVEALRESVGQYDPMPILMDDDSIPSQLRRICQQMLKKKPAQRYRDCTVLLSDLDAFQKARGSSAVATASEMRSYLDDPEGYKKRRREKPVALRERSTPSRSARSSDRKSVKEERPKKASEIDLKRLFTTVAVIVILFAGLSFAGSFFFSKDGQFGARNNPAGASKPAPAKNEGSTVAASRGQGGRTGGAVQAAGDEPAGEDGSAPVVENAPLVVVHEESRDEGGRSLPMHRNIHQSLQCLLPTR